MTDPVRQSVPKQAINMPKHKTPKLITVLAIRSACTVADVYSVLDFSAVWWVGRKFSRASSARVDREGRLVLQSCLAEAWLVKEAAAIQLASLIPDGRSPLR